VQYAQKKPSTSTQFCEISQNCVFSFEKPIDFFVSSVIYIEGNFLIDFLKGGIQNVKNSKKSLDSSLMPIVFTRNCSDIRLN
jgi:hypothetical protein